MIILKVFFSFIILFLVALSKRTFTKKSGVVTSNIDKRYNPINQEEQDSSSSSDDLKTMTEVCDQIMCVYIYIEAYHPVYKTKRRVKWVDSIVLATLSCHFSFTMKEKNTQKIKITTIKKVYS